MSLNPGDHHLIFDGGNDIHFVTTAMAVLSRGIFRADLKWQLNHPGE
jgi:hypothetical protein